MTRGPALGRGLNALIPHAQPERKPEALDAPNTSPPKTTADPAPITSVDVAAIEPNPEQPRQFLDPKSLEELAASILQNGVLQPILVRDAGHGRFMLIAGERRWRAAQIAGLDAVPIHISETNDDKNLILALVENIQRQDLSPLEESHAYKRLVDSGLTQERIAKEVGKSRTAVANSLRLLQLPTPVRMSLAAGEISEGHARAILGAPSEPQQIRLWERVRERNLTVRQAETAAQQLRTLDGAAQPPRPASPPGDHLAVERLQSALSTKVVIERRHKGGRIVLHWYDDEQLEQIVNQITSNQTAPDISVPDEFDI